VNISAQGAQQYYYEKDPILNPDGKNENTFFHGKGAEALGLEQNAKIEKEQFERLCQGKHPRSGEQLIQSAIDPQAKTEHRAATDIPFSAPKSFSIAALGAGKKDIIDIHNSAVKETMNRLESEYAFARDSQGKPVHTGNSVFVGATHSTSRANDPQIHTHVLTMNMTKRPDGKFVATHNDAIFRDQKYITSIYRAILSEKMVQAGYQLDSKGELIGIPKNLLENFSKRRVEIAKTEKELLKKGEIKSDGLRNKKATLESRPEKDSKITDEQLKEKWDEECKKLGYSKQGLEKSFNEAQKLARTEKEQAPTEKLTAQDYVKFAVKDAVLKKSVFSKTEVLREAAKLSYKDGIGMDRLEKAFQELNTGKEIVTLKDHQNAQQRGGYSTKEQIQAEKEVVKMAQEGKGAVKPIMSKEEAEKAIKDYEIKKETVLTTGQKDAALNILTTTDRINLIAGHAGSGKTFAMDAVNASIVAHNAGTPIRAMGFTGKAAAELEAKTGIGTTTVDRALIDIKKSTPDGNPKLWIIDEHSMLSSKKYHEIAKLGVLHNATIISVGDLKQKAAIEAGRPIHDIQDHAGLQPTKMSEILRQKPEWYKEITTELSSVENQKGIDQQRANRAVDFAFFKLDKLGKIQEVKNDASLKKETVKEYLENYKGSLIVTSTNKDRSEYNSMIREKLKEKGEVGKEGQRFTCYESKTLGDTDKRLAHNYEPGNYISVDLGAKGLGVKSGVVAEITGRDLAKNTINITYANRYGDQKRTINVMRYGNSLSLYEKKNIEFAAGDKILFLKNSTEAHKREGINVKNGMTGIVKSIGGGRITAQVGQREITWNIQDYAYMSHGYAMTTDKAQGSTESKVIMPSDTSKAGQHFKQFYTGITRGEKDVKIITTSKESLRELAKMVFEKSSTLDYEKTKTEIERKAISKMQKDLYPGLNKIGYIEEKLVDKIPLVKSFIRDIEKNHFSPNKAIELLKKKEQALGVKDVDKANLMTGKIKAEVSKMSPEQKAKYRQFVSQLKTKDVKAQGPEAQISQLDKSKSDKSHGSDSGKNQKTETQKSQSTGLEK
jgi:conjugative relaxase-like TrwC/TraI family protein